MYSLPQVYGNQPFDSEKYLPRCMYSARPYFETDDNNPKNQQSKALNNMSSILPLPLLPTDIDLKDANIKHTLDDVLSRQMLILCRLNQLEQQLLAQINTNTSNNSSSVSATTEALAALQLGTTQLEDVVVHFNLNKVPFAVFALVNAVRKLSSSGVMVNLHVHSSVANESGILARVAALRSRLQSTLGFQFTTPEEYLTRSQYQAIFTFVVTGTTQEPTVAFNAAQNVITGELLIAQRLVHLLAPTEQQLPNAAALWYVLTDPKQIASDKVVIEKLGQLVFNLSDSHFLFGQSKPSLTDVMLWALSVPEFQSASVAASLRGPQLLNPKWAQAVRQFASTL